ncbi:NuA3 HAT complex component NTO1 [Capronia epimyces CBS 606.96]|uniref:NuA3 HAT complex component NTO1 n=1 Tax=Capronia epimyces CBS 606.96 TaxID=1182542 RepID=W9XDC2_9EURO|nr:NuA3 HAT complex component NTO1 [Capronia epimyces CBS 606.96]EXJ78218.1 NuA3 HAT complex component NTO1 [Capronia epimyces CBS 606.96]
MGPLRNVQGRTRPRRETKNTASVFDDSERDDLADFQDVEPPSKRIRTSRKAQLPSKWIPGGRGGGGRHVDKEGTPSATRTPRGKNDYALPRTRPRTSRDRRRTMTSTPRYSARSRNRGSTRPRYSTAAAASAAVAHGDGYKPREERGWEEFHPDLDLEADFAVIPSEEIDGLVKKPTMNGTPEEGGMSTDGVTATLGSATPPKRRPGRPHRTHNSMVNALLTPEAPKLVPVPGPNPRERLTLPKPSYRILDPFVSYEQKDFAQVDFVDKSMANVGYQESEIFLRPARNYIRQTEGSAEEDLDLSPDLITNGENSAIGSSGVGRVEYDMDEQDVKWLESFNRGRIKDGVQTIKPAIFEITMTKIEKEWHALEKRIPKPNPKAPQTQRPRSSSAAAVNGEPAGEEPDSKCAICDDGDCENANAIVFCDGCDLAVHQECYGVPYIPEGQWLCRKCQLVGNSRPSCIFCPNEGGAFKQTNNSKWAHLFCATWIPEVTIGNPSLMEPITDVEKVPPGRWKLVCYICKQEMGASIQCSDGRCYEAFHLTCARQAGLYLRMKTGGGQNTLMDTSQLRAYCHRHTPADWKYEHNTDRAYEEATKYFKEHFRGQIWADSRASALAINDTHDIPNTDRGHLKVTLTNKKGQKQKTIWRLPSGAPVIPEVILKSIEDSLVRFTVQRKKEFVSEICKYWTLKREARRGAALLKRLQLQMDTFSSFEVTRRDYKAQGAAGRARLDRRIEFAERLADDMKRIVQLCDLIKQREALKLQEALMLKDVVDTVYFPIPHVLEAIVDKALKLDRGLFRDELLKLRTRVLRKEHTSVSSFAHDVVSVINSQFGNDAGNLSELVALVSGRAEDMSPEDRDRRTLARRIVKAIEPLIDDAGRKEAELNGRPYAQQIRELDEALVSRRDSLLAESFGMPVLDSVEPKHETGIASPEDGDVEMMDSAHPTNESPVDHETVEVIKDVAEKADLFKQDGLRVEVNGLSVDTPPASTNGFRHDHLTNGDIVMGEVQRIEPPTPPMSLQGHSQILSSQGGIPWYATPFDPEGTTIFEERWTGPEVLREMSEELSEMDEDELQGLGAGDDMAEATDGAHQALEAERTSTDSAAKKRIPKKAGKRGRSSGWSARTFRPRR